MQVQERKQINLRQALIVGAVTLSPFTALRISFFGISEVLFILFILLEVYEARGNLYLPEGRIGKYYNLFILVSLLGWAYNIFSGTNSGTTNSAIFNLASYVLTGITLLTIENKLQAESEHFRAKIMLKYIFVLVSIIGITLYLLSLRSSTLFGYRLRYYQYFSPLSNNIHQFAMVVIIMPFVGLYFATTEQGYMKKAAYIILSVLCAYMGIQTGSEKALIGIVAGTGCLVLLLVFGWIAKDDKQRVISFVVITLVILPFVFTNYNRILGYATNFFTENDNSGARQYLYSESIRIIIDKSPLVGLGPSVHVAFASGELYDAHETFLAAGLSAGIIGIALLISMMVVGMKRAIKNPFYFAATIPIAVYALGGDLLRKIAVWVIFILIAYAAEDSVGEGKKND